MYRAKIQVRVWETVEQGQNPEMRGLCLVKHGGVPRQLWGGKEQMKRIKLTTIKVGKSKLSKQVGGVSQQRLLPRVGFCMPRWAGEGNGNPLQYSCLGNPLDRGAW